MRKADKVVVYLNIDKANDLLGWKPEVGVREGVSRLIEWIKIR